MLLFVVDYELLSLLLLFHVIILVAVVACCCYCCCCFMSLFLLLLLHVIVVVGCDGNMSPSLHGVANHGWVLFGGGIAGTMARRGTLMWTLPIWRSVSRMAVCS